MTTSGANVLIVDDNADSGILIQEYMDTLGYRSAIATNGVAAIASARKSPPDLVLLDLLMPGMDGRETLAHFKADPALADIPIIVVSALDDAASITSCLAAGAEDYVTKPIEFEILRARATVCLERKRVADTQRFRLREMEATTESLRRELMSKIEELVGAYRRLADAPDADIERLGETTDALDRGMHMEAGEDERARLKRIAWEDHGILTEDSHIIGVIGALERIAATDSSVFIQGETGTGKELIARAVHRMSPRASGPFIGINCATLSPDLLRAELFGHVRGAFTGAVVDRAGLIAEASGGTLLLDEVAELDVEAQAMMLRFLQDRVYRRVGSNKEETADVRILSATHTSLDQRVAAGRFRSDLLYRLSVIPVFLPPLRERPGDILPLWNMYLARHSAHIGYHSAVSSRAVEPALLAYPWPGNVRELANAAELVAAMAAGGEPRVDQLPPRVRDAVAAQARQAAPSSSNPARPAVPSGAGAALEDFPTASAPGAPEAGAPAAHDRSSGTRRPLTLAEIEAALEAEGHSVTRAAQRLGVSRVTLWKRRKQLSGGGE